MSAQPSESETTDDFSVSNFAIGFVCGMGVILGWGALMSALQVPYVSPAMEAILSVRLLSLLHTAPDSGFMLGMYVIMWHKTKTPRLNLIGMAIAWSLIGGLLTYALNVFRVLLEVVFGEAQGGLVYAGLFGGVLALVCALALVPGRVARPRPVHFRGHLAALVKLPRASILEIALWTVDGVLVGLAASLAFSRSSAWLLLALPILILTMINARPAIRALAADRVRSVKALRSMLALLTALVAVALLALESNLAVPAAIIALIVSIIVVQKNDFSS